MYVQLQQQEFYIAILTNDTTITACKHEALEEHKHNDENTIICADVIKYKLQVQHACGG